MADMPDVRSRGVCDLMQTHDQQLVVTVNGEVLPQRQLQLTAGAAGKVGGDVDVDRFFEVECLQSRSP